MARKTFKKIITDEETLKKIMLYEQAPTTYF